MRCLASDAQQADIGWMAGFDRDTEMRLGERKSSFDLRCQQHPIGLHDSQALNLHHQRISIGQQQGYAGLKVDHDQRDSDVEVHDTPIYRPFPYAYGPCWGRCFGRPFWFDDGYYDVQRIARGRAVIRISVLYSKQFSPTDSGSLSVAALLSQMQSKWASAAY